jgi:hypothetical protein
MRRAGLAITVVLAALAVAIAWLTFFAPPAAPRFACIATSKAGWLTASSEHVVVRVHWGAGESRMGVSLTNGPPVWRPLDEAVARAQAEGLVMPLLHGTHTTTAGKVSVFVSCSGLADYWHGETGARPDYLDCLRPARAEPRLSCLERVLAERRSVGADERAGALAALLSQTAQDFGVTPPPDVGIHSAFEIE